MTQEVTPGQQIFSSLLCQSDVVAGENATLHQISHPAEKGPARGHRPACKIQQTVKLLNLQQRDFLFLKHVIYRNQRFGYLILGKGHDHHVRVEEDSVQLH